VWRFVKWIGGAIVIGGLLMQFYRPARTNPPTEQTRTLGARAPVAPESAAVLQRACRDCHSHDTEWPWYSNVAPVSWFVIDHVNHGRSHFNYSDWAKYDAEESSRLLEKACELARNGEMPLPVYVPMHPDARLSQADVDAICRLHP
jgi:hypothetical protein